MKLKTFNWIERMSLKDEDWVISEIMINPAFIVSVESCNDYWIIHTINKSYNVIDKPKEIME